jgi:hypothetical protein
MNVPVLSKNDLKELGGFGLNLDQSTPLCYYILRKRK